MDFYTALVYILSYIGILAASFYVVSLFSYYRKKKKPTPATNKTVTIIIPAFNEENSIKETIESALELDYPKKNLKIIVVDDGSKDSTYERAMEIAKNSKIVKVFKKQNGGKASALNYGLERAKSEIIVSMDADTFANKDALKIIIGYFKDENVILVSPSMGILNSKGFYNRFLQIEYYMGVFLRKSFASIDAIHVTPGAFSAYRKHFLDEFGGWEVGNITEDFELALRIQSKHKKIENAEEASVYTISPSTFKGLVRQRLRWNVGFLQNLWRYRRLFGFKHGALGSLVLPVAVSTIFLSVILTGYVFVKTGFDLIHRINFLESVNFQFSSLFEFNKYTLERAYISLFSNPVFLISVLFIVLIAFYVFFSRKKMLYKEDTKINFVLFILFYSVFFAFWWLISFGYILFGKEVKWRREDGKQQ